MTSRPLVENNLKTFKIQTKLNNKYDVEKKKTINKENQGLIKRLFERQNFSNANFFNPEFEMLQKQRDDYL